MANNKSALKRIKITKRNKLQNKLYKTSIKTLTKKFLIKVKSLKKRDIEGVKDTTEIQLILKILNLIYSRIDKACKKKIFHKNTAARKKSKLSFYIINAQT
jgi:small subunit ribosomal protein S20